RRRRERAAREGLPLSARRLSVCVDDYGIAPGIAAAVEALAAQGRLQAVSCLVTAPGWERDASRLAVLGPGVEAGLHLDLTEGRPLSPALARAWPVRPSLPQLLVRAHLHVLPLDALREEIDAQLDAFTAAAGSA